VFWGFAIFRKWNTPFTCFCGKNLKIRTLTMVWIFKKFSLASYSNHASLLCCFPSKEPLTIWYRTFEDLFYCQKVFKVCINLFTIFQLFFWVFFLDIASLLRYWSISRLQKWHSKLKSNASFYFRELKKSCWLCLV